VILYRLVGAAEWREALSAGRYAGSEHDRRDGFLHFSTAGQAAETAEKHYAGRTDLVLLFVDAARLDSPLKWEPSRGGALFPHLYGTLPVSAVLRAEPLEPGPGGRPRLPPLEGPETGGA
jgi:uncharacterized protein (DUF952 family)